ncbi:MAG: alpha/beta hydrolase [Bacteroidetes bacterium HGW-Bacteroidetes-20]|nr:MAG: alpha/beta hydrolase [Bacteroidetes bacterium HGW-Bacteroidetes-20]
MKKIVLALLTGIMALSAIGQEITGQWSGVLKIQGTQLRIVFNIKQTDGLLSATMDSPDQGAFGIPVSTVSFENPNLKIAVATAGIEYEGVLENGNSIVGNFVQGGLAIPLNLSNEIIEIKKGKRPQEPVKPYQYYSEELTFENKSAGIVLAGTLTLPAEEGVFPAVVLISGSGPQNRDEEVFGHKPFLVLSDFLTRNGIAVLRYDDRGTASSTGDFGAATTMDLSTDVEAAVAYFNTRKEIDKKKIGLIGHSEGGIIAPIVASRNDDIAFIVLLAGTAIPGDQLLLMQQQLIANAMGVSDEELQKSHAINSKIFELIVKSNEPEQLKTDLTEYLIQAFASLPGFETPGGMSMDEYVKVQVEQLCSPWMLFFIKYNPALVLEQVKCPVLAINGEKDLQVPPKENLEAIKKALNKGGNIMVTTKELPGLNHLFQESSTGSPSEYGDIEQTFSPNALKVIFDWIQARL